VKRINSTTDGREPDWQGVQRLVEGVVSALSVENDIVTAEIVAQARTARVDEIDFTGHGFYANLAVSVGRNARTAQLHGSAEGEREQIGIVVWFDAGPRICVEGFNAGDPLFTGADDYRIGFSRKSPLARA